MTNTTTNAATYDRYSNEVYHPVHRGTDYTNATTHSSYGYTLYVGRHTASGLWHWAATAMGVEFASGGAVNRGDALGAARAAAKHECEG